MQQPCCLIYSTHPSLEQARETASLLLDQKLAACCNILGAIESHYEWEGKREQAQEVAMLSKTTEAHAARVMRVIQSAHPYDCPAILQIPLMGGNPAFLDWVSATISN